MGGVRIAILTERMLAGFGADLVLHEIAQGLSGRGYEVDVFASVNDGTYKNSDYDIKSLPVPASSFFPRYEKNAQRQIKRILARDYHAILVGTFPYFSLIPALSEVTPCLAIEFGVCLTTGFSLWAKSNFAYMKHCQEKVYFPKAKRIIAISNFLKSQLPEALQAKTDVIYCGANHYRPEPAPRMQAEKDREEFRKQLGVKPDEVVALYVGRVNAEGQPYKGTAELIQIYERMKPLADFRLVMTGRGTGNDAELLERHGILPYLNVMPSEMPTIYESCDIFVTCSKWEGFGLPLIEAQYFGKPFVAYRIGAHPEIGKTGETGLLVQSRQEFIEALTGLVQNRTLRSELGENGKRWARMFTWEKAVDEYDRVINEALDTRRTVAASKWIQPPLVSVVLVNYKAPMEMLEQCIESLSQQTIANLEIIVVDNGSLRDFPEYLVKKYQVIPVLLRRNHGFSYAVNRGIERATGKYVLISNFDVKYAPEAVEEMIKVIEESWDIAGVAPKTLLMGQTLPYIDNIGNLINPAFQAFNMGIGQLDLGQYDHSEAVFGVCLAAALIRKHAFKVVGPLDEDYFMYYEDIDWCYRANLCGLKFQTAPKAIVYHHHSVATKNLPYSFKYVLIQLNLLRTLIKSVASSKLAVKMTLRIFLNHLRILIINRAWVKPTAQILCRFIASLPKIMRKRRSIQKYRVVSDENIWKHSFGEQPFFDPVKYTPIISPDVLLVMFKRRYLVDGEEQDLRVAEALESFLVRLRQSKVQFESEILNRKLLEIMEEHLEKEDLDMVKEYVAAIIGTVQSDS